MGSGSNKIFDNSIAVFCFCGGMSVIMFAFYIFRGIDFQVKEYRESATTVTTQIDTGMKEEYVPGASLCEQLLKMDEKITSGGVTKPMPLYVGSQNMNARYSSGETVLERIQQGDYELLYAIVNKTAMYQAEYTMDKGNVVGIKFVKKG